MTLNAYLLGLKVSAFLAFFAWALVVLYVNPDDSGMFGKILFYGTLFLWFSGAASLFLTWMQKKIADEERAAKLLVENMKQGLIISFFLIVLLMLQYYRVLVLWSSLLVLVVFLLVELRFVHAIFPSKKHDAEDYRNEKFKMKPLRSRFRK